MERVIRYSIDRETVAWKLVLAMVMAGAVALPLSGSAQSDEEDATAEPNLQEPAPSPEPASQEPVLQLELDSTGVDVVRSPPPTVDAYTVEEMELRVKRARIGLISSASVFPVGVTLFAVAVANTDLMGDVCLWEPCPPPPPEPKWVERVGITGGVLMLSSTAGMIVSGVLLGVRKRDLSWLVESRYEGRRRVQWDLAKSRLVF